MDNKGSWCQVWGPEAIAFNPIEPTVEMVNIYTIAHALAQKCRFNGQTIEFMSVAQHSLLVSYHCDLKDALWGLLHDASEAYLVDLPRPVKRWPPLKPYLELDEKIQNVICDAFGLGHEMPESVIEADDTILQLEWRDNMQPCIKEIFTTLLGNISDDWEPLEYMTIKESESAFISRFHDLVAQRG